MHGVVIHKGSVALQVELAQCENAQRNERNCENQTQQRVRCTTAFCDTGERRIKLLREHDKKNNNFLNNFKYLDRVLKVLMSISVVCFNLILSTSAKHGLFSTVTNGSNTSFRISSWHISAKLSQNLKTCFTQTLQTDLLCNLMSL